MSLPTPGSSFGPYVIGDRLGRGAMGIVFAARHRGLERDVAVKLLSPDLADDVEYRNRFTREAKVLAQLDSPYVVRVYDTGVIDGWWYIATELVGGGDLKTRLEAGPLPVEVSVRLVREVAIGLSIAHGKGILHRDIKPSNVLLRSVDGGDQAVLCDLGISAVTDGDHTRTNGVVGTLGYLAPERHRGEPATVESDVYALGCLLWACLSGKAPYTGSDVDVALGHISGEIPALAGSGATVAHLNGIIAAAMAKDPAARFRSAADFVRALDEIGDVGAETVVGVPYASPDTAATIRSAAAAGTLLTPPPQQLPPPTVPVPPPAPLYGHPAPSLPPRQPRRGVSPVLVAAIILGALVLGGGAAAAALFLTRDNGSASASGTQPGSGRSTLQQSPTSAPTVTVTDIGSGSGIGSICGRSATGYDRAVLAGSPMAYFPLADSSYAICDAVAGQRIGSYLPGVTLGAAGPGNSPGAINATSGVGSAPVPPITGGSGITLETWFRSSSPSDQSLVTVGDGNGVGARAGLTAWSGRDSKHSPRILCPQPLSSSVLGLDSVKQSNCFDTTTVGVDLFDGRWHFLAVTVDSSGTVWATVDGNDLGTQSLAVGPLALSAGSSVRLGTWQDSYLNQPLSGSLARAAVFAAPVDHQGLLQRYRLGLS